MPWGEPFVATRENELETRLHAVEAERDAERARAERYREALMVLYARMEPHGLASRAALNYWQSVIRAALDDEVTEP